MSVTPVRKLPVVAALLASICSASPVQQRQHDGTEPEAQKVPEERSTNVTQRMLRKQAIVTASPAEVWRAWTTVEGVKSGVFRARLNSFRLAFSED